MPIRIPDALPAAAQLESENIFVMTEYRALHQDIRPLRVLILNLMPTKIATETQIMRKLSNTPLQVEVALLRTKTHEATHVSAGHLETFYRTFDDIRDIHYDGLIITGANWVDNNIEVHSPGSFPCPTICPGKYIKAARELTDRVHAFDTKIFVQLTAGLGRSAMPAMIHDRKFVAPSTISNRWNPRIECRELTTEEVERRVEQFGVSAAIANKCGYDGVEVHAVHEGYLLDCFAMSLFNKRTD